MPNPTNKPSVKSTLAATSEGTPSGQPTKQPTEEPTGKATEQSTSKPTLKPSVIFGGDPSGQPSGQPTGQPTEEPTGKATEQSTPKPTLKPSVIFGGDPSMQPSRQPSRLPLPRPTSSPFIRPFELPSGAPALLNQQSPSGDYSLGRINVNDPKVLASGIVGVAFLVALGVGVVKWANRQSVRTEEVSERSEIELQPAQTTEGMQEPQTGSRVSLDGDDYGDDYVEGPLKKLELPSTENTPATSPTASPANFSATSTAPKRKTERFEDGKRS